MEIEIETTEKWWIGDELNINNSLSFENGSRLFWFAGEWRSAHPTNPQLRAAVEKQWNKLRPLKENEWRDGSGVVCEFRIREGIPEWHSLESNSRFCWFKTGGIEETELGKACLAWFEKNRPLAEDDVFLLGERKKLIGAGLCSVSGRPVVLCSSVNQWFPFGNWSDEASKERAQSYWLKNYQWKEDEYLDRESGTVKRMADDEVRLIGGSKYRVGCEKTIASGIDAQQTERYRRICERNSDPLKINGLDVVASESYTVDKHTAFVGNYAYRLRDSYGTWHSVTKERFDRFHEALFAKRRTENIVNGYEFRMGPVQVRNVGDLRWYDLSEGDARKPAAQEWMKRKGIKL